MGLTTTQIALWLSAFILELIACVLVFRRRWDTRLPFFSAYLMVVAAREAFLFCVYRAAGYTSKPALYSAWIAQIVLLVGRGLSIGELAWITSRPYPGFRVVTKWVLALTAFLLLLRAAIASIANASRLPQFVLTLEADLEIAAAVVLVLLFVLAGRYEANLPASEKLIAAGLLTYSLVQVVNNSILNRWLQSYFHGWNIVRAASFHVALILWLIALANPSPTLADRQGASETEEARDFMTKGTAALQELSSQLTRFRRKL
jgi:hypothetical protein